MHDQPRRPGLPILVAVTAMGPLALNVFIPSMPGLQRVFGTDYATVQLTLTLYLIGVALAQLVYGPLSDRFGRRPVLLAGLWIFLAGTLACLFAPSIEALIAGRVLQAVGACSGLVLSRAIIRDMFERARAASMMAYVMMAMVVAPMIAPSIGGFLDVWFDWRASFVFVGVVGVLVLAASTMLLHETHHTRGRAQGPTAMLLGFVRLLRIPAFDAYAFQTAFSSAAFFSFLGGAPYVMVELFDRTPGEYGLFFLCLASMYMVGNGLSGRLSTRLGPDRMIWIGVILAQLAMMALFVVELAGLTSPWTLFGLMGFVSIGNGLSLPNGMAGAVSVDPRLAGTASGLAGFLQLGIGAAGSYTVGLLLAGTAMPLIAVMLAGTTLGLAAHAWGRSLARR